MPTDEQLVAEYLDGNEAALHTIIERYLRPIYGFVYRYVGSSGDAEDITQDVFVSVWRNIRKFDRAKKFKTWIFAIAKNASLNWLSKKKPRSFSEFEDEGGDNPLLESAADTAPLPDKIFERSDFTDKLTEAINKLHPKYREVLLLHYNSGFTFQEIAELSKEPLNTVKSRHRRALVLLRGFIVR